MPRGAVGPELDWDAFEARLAAALARMVPETFLVLSVPYRGGDGAGPYVQFAHSGRHGLRAEASSSHYLAPRFRLAAVDEERLGGLGWQWPDADGDHDRNFHREWPNPAPWAEMAALAVHTLRDVFGVAAPSALRALYRGFPEFAGRLPRLALGIPAGRRRTDEHAAGDGPPPPAHALAGLNRRLEDALKDFLGQDELIRDEDGDIPVRVGSALMYVRALAGTPPLVQLFAPILEDVEPTLAVLEELNEINRRMLFGRIFRGNRTIIVAMEITGVDLTAAQVAFACVQLGSLADHLDDELRAKFAPDSVPPRRRLVN
jgi:hypothetical protein